ncbi:hypothetical protein [Vibrio phage LV6]|nr:hypothetical protein [Vibrio phage LV6]
MKPILHILGVGVMYQIISAYANHGTIDLFLFLGVFAFADLATKARR